MTHSIARSTIQGLLQANAPITLVEALPEKYYREGHLPGAVHLPHDQVRERAAQLLPDKNAFIVTYCANTPCQNSAIAAKTLVALGYTNVHEYIEGKQDWVDAGLALEPGTAQAA